MAAPTLDIELEISDLSPEELEEQRAAKEKEEQERKELLESLALSIEPFQMTVGSSNHFATLNHQNLGDN